MHELSNINNPITALAFDYGTQRIGVAIGKHEYFHDSGRLESKGEFEGGEKSGDWKYYNEFGNVIQTLSYVQGVLTKVNGQKFTFI